MSEITPERIQYYEQHAGDNLGGNIIAANAAGLGLAYIAVGLRCLARKQKKVELGIDDWLIIIALAPLTAYSVTGFLVASFGEGRHIIFVNNVPGFIQGYVTAITAYACTVVVTKISILCFYCRIFPSKRLKKMCWLFSIFIFLYDLALILVAALECIPLSSLWTHEQAVCFNALVPYTTLGIVNVVTDFTILLIPVYFVKQLQLKRLRKIQVCGIFLLGGLFVVPMFSSVDSQVWSGIWSFCEISIGIVAACLPTFGILASKVYLSSLTTAARRLVSYPFTKYSRGLASVPDDSNRDFQLSNLVQTQNQTWSDASHNEPNEIEARSTKDVLPKEYIDTHGIRVDCEIKLTRERI